MARKSRKEERKREVLTAIYGEEKICPDRAGIRNTRFQTAAYTRLSAKDSGKEGTAVIETQKAMLQDFIEADPSLWLKEIYEDNGESGTNFERPAFQRMMRDIRNGEIDCVVVKDLSRLGRNYLEAGEYIETIFPLYGVRFIAVSDRFDSKKSIESAQSLVVPFQNVLNDFYARDISDKIRSALQTKQAEGNYIGNFAPYGYRKDPCNRGHLLPDTVTAPYVTKIFEWKADGISDRELMERIKDQQIPSVQKYRYNCGLLKGDRCKDAEWKTKTLRRMLCNPVYLGHMVQGMSVSIWYAGKGRQEKRSKDWNVVLHTHEPLVSPELFIQVQRALSAGGGAEKP